MVAWMMEQLIEWLTGMTLGFLDFALQLLTNLVWYVPDVTVLPAVRAVWGQNMTIVNTVYILAVVAAGVIAMTYETVQIRYGVKELLPRLVLGALAANFSYALLGQVLRAADALVQAIAGAPLGDDTTRSVVEMHVTSALASPSNAVLSLIMALLAVLLLIVLLAQWYVRLAILVVLAMIAPLALACYALPGLEQAAGLWWRTLFGTLGTQGLQALMIVGGLRVFLDPDAQLVTVLPVGAAGQLATVGSPTNLMIMIVVLYTTFKVPAMMRRWVLRSGGGSGARVAVVLLAQQVTRGLSRAGGAGTRAVARVRP
jgi:hypothetical protein